jgi:hypothetical protein
MTLAEAMQVRAANEPPDLDVITHLRGTSGLGQITMAPRRNRPATRQRSCSHRRCCAASQVHQRRRSLAGGSSDRIPETARNRGRDPAPGR